jgi:Tfp pilus assembly protein PilZ
MAILDATKKIMDIRVLLIVQEDSARNKYLEALENCGVHVFVSTSFQDFSQEICSQSFHGIFLDLPTKIKAVKKNKNYVYGLLENFPISHLRINDDTGEVHCFHVGHESTCTLTDFIDNECRNFVPRMIRSDVRKEIHFNVRLYKTPDRDIPERSVTMNVSKGGCFIFSVEDWKIGDPVWIEIVELPDSYPITGSIRHIVKWGESRRIPGIGVEFLCISESLTAELSIL